MGDPLDNLTNQIEKEFGSERRQVFDNIRKKVESNEEITIDMFEGKNYFIATGVIYGSLLFAQTNTIFEVVDEDNNLHTVTTRREDAKELAKDINGDYRMIDVELSFTPVDFINELKQESTEVASLYKSYGEEYCNTETISSYDNFDPVLKGVLDEDSEKLISYSILYGMLLENSHPDILVVADNNGVKRAVHGARREELEKEGNVTHMYHDTKES